MSLTLPWEAWLSSQPADDWFIEAPEIVRRLLVSFPNAMVDWDRGRRVAEARLQRLIDLGMPEILLLNDRHLIDRTVHVTVAFSEWPGHAAEMLITGVEREDSGLVVTLTDPTKLDFLLHAADRLATALDFQYMLHAEFEEGFQVSTWCGDIVDSRELAHQHLAYSVDTRPVITVTELNDWQTALHAAVMHWVQGFKTNSPMAAAIKRGASCEDLASGVVADIAAISPVRSAWRALLKGDGYQHVIILDQAAWTTVFHFCGTPHDIRN